MPSVFGQLNQSFKWIVLTDRDGPHIELDPRITQLRVSGKFWQFELALFLSGDCEEPFIITTRLDNDDAFHEDTVDDIQNCFNCQEMEFLNLRNGFLIHGNKVYKSSHASNQFITLIEASDNPKTVYVDTHGNAKNHGIVRQLTGKRYWVRMMHNRNMVRDNMATKEYCGKIQVKGFNLWPS